MQRQAFAKYLFIIPNAFRYIKWHQRVGVENGPRPRSAVDEFIIMKARDVTLSKFGSMAYSWINFIGFVLNTLSPQLPGLSP